MYKSGEMSHNPEIYTGPYKKVLKKRELWICLFCPTHLYKIWYIRLFVHLFLQSFVQDKNWTDYLNFVQDAKNWIFT